MYIRAVNIAILSDTLALLKFDLHREIIERTKNVPPKIEEPAKILLDGWSPRPRPPFGATQYYY